MKVNDRVIVFNCTEWSKTGDLPEGNDKYYQNATILKIRRSDVTGDLIADVLFDSGLISKGHFLHGIKPKT